MHNYPYAAEQLWLFSASVGGFWHQNSGRRSCGLCNGVFTDWAFFSALHRCYIGLGWWRFEGFIKSFLNMFCSVTSPAGWGCRQWEMTHSIAWGHNDNVINLPVRGRNVVPNHFFDVLFSLISIEKCIISSKCYSSCYIEPWQTNISNNKWTHRCNSFYAANCALFFYSSGTSCTMAKFTVMHCSVSGL